MIREFKRERGERVLEAGYRLIELMKKGRQIGQNGHIDENAKDMFLAAASRVLPPKAFDYLRSLYKRVPVNKIQNLMEDCRETYDVELPTQRVHFMDDEDELNGMSNVRCYSCGEAGHFAAKCGNGRSVRFDKNREQLDQRKTDQYQNQIDDLKMKVDKAESSLATHGKK